MVAIAWRVWCIPICTRTKVGHTPANRGCLLHSNMHADQRCVDQGHYFHRHSLHRVLTIVARIKRTVVCHIPMLLSNQLLLFPSQLIVGETSPRHPQRWPNVPPWNYEASRISQVSTAMTAVTIKSATFIPKPTLLSIDKTCQASMAVEVLE